MHRRCVTVLLCAAAVLGVPATAGAVTVTAGSPALITWANGAGLQLAERTSGGTIGAARTIAPPRTSPAFAYPGAGGAANVFAYSDFGPASGMVRIERAPGAREFQPPVPFGPPGVHVLRSASNARGDVAVLARIYHGPLLLLTASRGGPLSTQHQLPTGSSTTAVAIDREGRFVAAWYDFAGGSGASAILGSVDGPLGPVRRLSASATFSEVGAAIDDTGTATVAFSRADAEHRERPAELVVRRTAPDGRFGPARVVARGGPPIMGAGFASVRLAAAGRTTALAFDANDVDGRLGVAIARGDGRFGGVQRPTTAVRASFRLQPFHPAVAVDRAGDVLLTYNFGFYGNAVHATERRAGSDRFTSPRVLSSLGHGGAAVPALFDDRTRLVAYDDRTGALRTKTRLVGRRPDLTPPRVDIALLPGTEATLRETNGFGARIRCSEACLLSVRATLRTPTGRTIRYERDLSQRAGVGVLRRFEFDPARRAGRARDDSILRVTVDAENASGAGEIRLG